MTYKGKKNIEKERKRREDAENRAQNIALAEEVEAMDPDERGVEVPKNGKNNQQLDNLKLSKISADVSNKASKIIPSDDVSDSGTEGLNGKNVKKAKSHDPITLSSNLKNASEQITEINSSESVPEKDDIIVKDKEVKKPSLTKKIASFQNDEIMKLLAGNDCIYPDILQNYVSSDVNAANLLVAKMDTIEKLKEEHIKRIKQLVHSVLDETLVVFEKEGRVYADKICRYLYRGFFEDLESLENESYLEDFNRKDLNYLNIIKIGAKFRELKVIPQEVENLVTELFKALFNKTEGSFNLDKDICEFLKQAFDENIPEDHELFIIKNSY